MKRIEVARPVWVDIDSELKLLLRPLRLSECRALLRSLAGAGLQDLDEAASVDRALDAFDAAVGQALQLIETHVEDWTVVDDAGARLPVERATVEALFDAEPQLVGAVLARVAAQFAGRLAQADAEKNGSAPSPSGTSAGAVNSAVPASGSAPSAATS